MLKDNKCPVCLEVGQKIIPRGALDEYYDCQCIRCGDFKIEDWPRIRLLNCENEIQEGARANISGWLREHPGCLITTNDLNTLLQLKKPSVAEKAQKLLKAIDKKCSVVGEQISISFANKSWWAISWSFSEKEIAYLLNDYLTESRGLLIGKTNLSCGMYKVSPDGYAYLQKLRETNEDSQKGFCAMWFSDDTKELWSKGIGPGINSAGYQPFRVDKHEHVNKIDDEILASIRSSKFCVADFTHGDNSGVRGGVYFEAGFALGLGRQVIWTCREDFIDEKKNSF